MRHLIGVGATVIMDLWALFLKVSFGVSGLDISMLGRWIGHMARGQFMHAGIANSPSIMGERLIGWSAHYGIGIVIAAALLSTWGLEWLEKPTMLPALAIAIVTLVFPYCIMQPCFGLGFAASNLPDPNIIRIKSLVAHMAYGVGLYLCGHIFYHVART